MRAIPYLAVLLCAFACCASVAQPGPAPSDSAVPDENPAGEISLAQALSLALRQNPELRIFAWDIRAAEARRLQAGLRPNPDLSLEIEDLRFSDGPGTRARSTGISRALSREVQTLTTPNGDIPLPVTRRSFAPEFEYIRESGAEAGLADATLTLRLSQLIELGGKRARRVQHAQRERETAAWDYEVARANALAETASLYYEVLAAQERQQLARELAALAATVRDTVVARVAAGKVSPIEQSKAEVECANAVLDANRYARALESARTRLAAQWGATTAMFDRAAGSFDTPAALLTLEELQARIAQSPGLARWTAEMAQRDAAVALERANAKPDLTVTLGLRSTGESARESTAFTASGFDTFGYARGATRPDDSRETSVVVDFALPLPLFNRNQGRILESQHLAAKAADQYRAESVQLHAGLTAAYSALRAAADEAAALTSEILPKAQESFDATSEGYRLGKFGLLDVLTAESTLFNSRSRLLEARAECYRLTAEIERLTGISPQHEKVNTP